MSEIRDACPRCVDCGRQFMAGFTERDKCFDCELGRSATWAARRAKSAAIAAQTRLESLVETCLSTLLGLAVSLVAQRLVFPLYGFHPSLDQNLGIAAFFTIASVLRGYAVRRFFATGMHRAAVAIAARLARLRPPSP